MTPEAEAIKEIFMQIRPEIMWLIIQSLAYTLIAGIILGVGIVLGVKIIRKILS